MPLLLSPNSDKNVMATEVQQSSSQPCVPSDSESSLKDGSEKAVYDTGPACQNIEDEECVSSCNKSKKKIPGVIYLSAIPDFMQYRDLYRTLSEFGEIGRISLQDSAHQPWKKVKKYDEGWVEFLSKKDAKRCVLLCNGSTVGGKRKSKWYDAVWSMKYLPKFKWHHLTERLAFEKATHQQRMRTEIAQAKREAAHFAEQLDRKQFEDKMSSKPDWESKKRTYDYTQRSTDEEIKKRKAGTARVKHIEKCKNSVISNLFGGTSSD